MSMPMTFALEFIPFFAHSPLIYQLIKYSLEGYKMHDAPLSNTMGIPSESGLIINADAAASKRSAWLIDSLRVVESFPFHLKFLMSVFNQSPSLSISTIMPYLIHTTHFMGLCDLIISTSIVILYKN